MTALSTNSNYLVSLRRGSGGQEVKANANTKLSIAINNQWVNVLQALGFSGDSSNDKINAMSSGLNAFQIFSGNTFLPEIATTQVWRGSNGLELQLIMRFDAYDDAYTDVMQPVQNLVQMWMPIRGGSAGTGGSKGSDGFLKSLAGFVGGDVGAAFMKSFLEPPGPTPYEFAKGQANEKLLTLSIGNFLIITRLIPGGLQYEFEQRTTTGGLPIAAQVTIGLMSYVIPDQKEVLSYFRTSGQGDSSFSTGQGLFNISGNDQSLSGF